MPLRTNKEGATLQFGEQTNVDTQEDLSTKGFDPLDIDLSYIEETCAKIPKDGSLDLNEAERLATIFLRCSDYCGELLAMYVLSQFQLQEVIYDHRCHARRLHVLRGPVAIRLTPTRHNKHAQHQPCRHALQVS